MHAPNRINMPEAEVSLLLADWLIRRDYSSTVQIALDGAQVEINGEIQFELAKFVAKLGWRQVRTTTVWQGDYIAHSSIVRIHSSPGRGDVVATLPSGRTLRAECKKGPLLRVRSSVEYRLLREAVGQLLTVAEADDSDLFLAAVPHTPKFVELAARWRDAPLVKRAGIRIATVDRNGDVYGVNLE